MPLPVSLLRRWLVIAAVMLMLSVAGAYLYAKWRIENALKQVPEKIGLEIQQSAQGFTISKSEAGHTIFKVQASKAVQYKAGERATLHDVNITLYGPDSKRFDQIYGADFEYDLHTGDITAKGDVQIDLEANPAGLAHADQAVPEELKNPIHVRTRGLVFNKNSGNAYTKEKVEFGMPQAHGSAVGATYDSKSRTLTLQSDIQAAVEGPSAASISASRAIVTQAPRVVTFERARGQNSSQNFAADEVKLHLRPDNTLERIVASGQVTVISKTDPPAEVHSSELELRLASKSPTLETAVFSGGVRWESSGEQHLKGQADRAVLNFHGKNQLARVHTEGNVKLEQPATPPTKAKMDPGKAQQRKNTQPEASGQASDQPSTASNRPAGEIPGGARSQDLEITAQAVDFMVTGGRHLQRAETSGPAQVVLLNTPPSDAKDKPTDGATPGDPPDPGKLPTAKAQNPNAKDQTIVTANHFEARFDEKGHLAFIHGAPQARIVNSIPGHPDRTSSSDSLGVAFHNGQIESIVQQGSVAYDDGAAKASGERARYTVADQILVLSGSPRVTEGGMTTTADLVRLNRASGDALAQGNVKTTYSDLKPQPDGSQRASSDPVHVTAPSMSSNRASGIVQYRGGCRLWQGPNVIQAPTVDFDRKRHAIVANGSPDQPVSTVLLQPTKAASSKGPAASPVTITSAKLNYVDPDHRARFDGNVTAKSGDATITAAQASVFLQAHASEAAAESGGGMGKVERIVAEGQVVLTDQNRRATGDQLTYTTADDKFVLSGGPPSIFDAEHGKITGVSLTFFRHDDRVLVNGTTINPAVTQTRVAR